jgi:hypothetical protein
LSKAGLSVGLVALVSVSVLAGCVGGGAELTDDTHAGHATGVVSDEGRELPAHIRGIVIDSELLPVPQADVVITPGDLVLQTDEAGMFLAGPLAAGAFVVTVQKPGYKTTDLSVNVVDDRESKVRISLEAVGSDVPYHETLTRVMFLYCSLALNFGADGVGYAPLSAPCMGLVDIGVQTVTGGTNTNTLDTWTFDFVIDKTGFKSLVMEMVWPPQQFAANGLMQLTELAQAEANDAGGVTVAGSRYGASMQQPFHDLIHAGYNYWNGGEDPETTFYPNANETKSFQMIIAGYNGNTSIPAGGSAVFLNFKPTVYLTFFYNRPALPEFSILPPE